MGGWYRDFQRNYQSCRNRSATGNRIAGGYGFVKGGISFARSSWQMGTKIAGKTGKVARKELQYVAGEGMQLCQQNRNIKITQLEGKLSEWLGPETKMIKNQAGDPVFLSNNTERRIRFDFNNPHGDRPHMHIEIKINSKWKEATSQHRIYPIVD